MTDSQADTPLDPAQVNLMRRVKWLMALSGLATLIGIASVLGVISYRLSRTDLAAATAADVVAQLPKGARVIQTAVAGETIVVTLEAGGTTEVRTFDARTLRPLGRLRMVNEP